MANYNTFLIYDCEKRKPILVTSSARKASKFLTTGIRIDVWNDNRKIESIYESCRKREENPLSPYITLEKEYVQKRQIKAEQKNKRRKGNGYYL